MHNVKGRMTIRKETSSSLPGNPLNPVDGRPNKVIGLWTLEPGDDALLGQVLSAYEASLAVIDGRDAYEAADEDLRSEVGIFNASDWEDLTKDVQPSAPVPWIRKQGQGWHHVDMTTWSTRPATKEQIKTGREFKSYAEYAAANGLPPEPPPRPNIFDTARNRR